MNCDKPEWCVNPQLTRFMSCQAQLTVYWCSVSDPSPSRFNTCICLSITNSPNLPKHSSYRQVNRPLFIKCVSDVHAPLYISDSAELLSLRGTYWCWPSLLSWFHESQWFCQSVEVFIRKTSVQVCIFWDSDTLFGIELRFYLMCGIKHLGIRAVFIHSFVVGNSKSQHEVQRGIYRRERGHL